MSGVAAGSGLLAVDVVQSYAGGLTVSVGELPAEVLSGVFAEIARVRHRMDVLEAAVTSALHSASVNGKAAVRSEQKRAGARGVDRRIEVALALDAMPESRAAFDGGGLAFDYVAALAAAREFLPEQFAADEPALVAKAEGRSVSAFRREPNLWKMRHDPERFAASLPEAGVSLRLRNDGLYKLEGLSSAEDANTISKAVELLADRAWRVEHPEREEAMAPRAPFASRFAEALVEACRLALSEGGAGSVAMPVRYRLGWLVDHRTMTEGLHDHSVCMTDQGDPIPVWRARQLACEVGILPIVLGGDGVPIDLGREKRWFNDDQRQAITAMFPRCALHSCLPTRQCALHHVQEWRASAPPGAASRSGASRSEATKQLEEGGRTDVINGVPLCAACHQIIHRLGLRIQRAGEYLEFRYPDGTEYSKTRCSFPTSYFTTT